MASRGLLYHLAREARSARAGHVRQVDIATRAKVAHTTISRFEQGQQPERLFAIIAAYEDECGLERHDLWDRALQAALDDR